MDVGITPNFQQPVQVRLSQHGAILGRAWAALLSGAFFVCAALSGAVTVLACFKVEETNPAVTGQAAAAAGPPDKKGPPQGKPDAQPSKGFGLPIWGCVLSMFLNAFCFSTMNALATLTINVQFGWGPTEIGIFLAIVGALQVLMTAGIGPWLINKIGAPLTNVIGSVWSGAGILYPLVETVGPQLVFWLLLCWGWALMQPSLSTAIGAVCRPDQRKPPSCPDLRIVSCQCRLCVLSACALFACAPFVLRS